MKRYLVAVVFGLLVGLVPVRVAAAGTHWDRVRTVADSGIYQPKSIKWVPESIKWVPEDPGRRDG